MDRPPFIPATKIFSTWLERLATSILVVSELNANFELVGMLKSAGNNGQVYLGNYTRLDMQAENFNALVASCTLNHPRSL